MIRYITIIIIIIVSGLILSEIRDMYRNVTTDDEQKEWCLVADLPRNGGSFSESGGPGEYEYQVINTESGYKVFQRCAKIE